MPGRRVEDVRHELEHERDGLSEAVGHLREETGKLKSKLPVVLGGAVASLLAVRALARRARRT